MNKRYNSIDRLDKKGRSSSIKNILHLGGENVVLGPKFDIKKYFNEIGRKGLNDNSPKKTTDNKLSLLYPSISPKSMKNYNNNISTANYRNQIYCTIENESITNHSSNKYIFNTNHSSKNIYKNSTLRNNTISNTSNCFITSVGIEQNPNNNKTIDARDYIISFNSSHNNIRKRLFSNKINNLNRVFHVSSVVKEIKEKYKTKNDLDIKNDYIAYSKENIDSVLNHNNIIKNYEQKNMWNLKLNEDNYHNFLKNNIKIYKQNILSKLVNKEREKVLENGILYEKNIEDKKNQIINDEKEFENIVSEQKYYNKIIDDYRIKLQDTNRDLYYLKSYMSLKVQNKEAELMKKLFEMEELRGYAKFVNNMLGKDISMFEKEIYPMNYEKKIEMNSLVKNAFEIYKDYLSDKNTENESKGNEPEIIYDGFLGLEGKIRYGIEKKEEEYKEIKRIKKNNKLILDEIIRKKNFYEEEYQSLKNECNEVENFILKEERKIEKYFHSLAKELFIYILEIFSKENINKYKANEFNNEVLNLIKITELAEKTKNCISEKELFINESIRKIEILEKENPIKFEEILESAKDRIILERQKEAKELRKIKEKIKKIQAIKKLEKINFIIRRIEQPFHVKKKTQVKIDPLTIKEKEDKELITYK